MEQYSAFILRRPWLVLSLAMLLMLVAAAGAKNLTVSGSYRVLFGENNAHLLAFDRLQDTYSASRSALIAISPREGSVFTRETLSAIEELTELSWRTPHSVRVDSLANHFHIETAEDDLIIAPLVEDAASYSDAELDRIQTIALNEPELVGALVSDDGKTAGIVISFTLLDPEEPKWAEISGYLGNLLDKARASHPELSYFLTGNVILNQTFADAGKDAGKLIPIVFVIVLVIVSLLLRSVYTTLSIIITVAFIVLSTMGVAGWLGTTLTPISAGVPIIIMAIGVAHAIHIVTAAQSCLRKKLERNAAISESLRINLYPIFLTSVTTAIGFLSLNLSNSPPFHVLGNLVAIGVLFAFVFSVTFLPTLLFILPLRALSRNRTAEFFNHFGAFIVARRKLILWSSIFVAVVLLTGVPRIELRDNWLHHFSERFSFRTDTDFIIENLTGLDRLEYSLNAGSEGGITHPEYLRAVEAFANWFRTQPEVHHVQAFSDITKRMNKTMNGNDPALYRIPDSPELAAQYLLLYEFSLPFGADLNDRLNIDKSATRMTVVLHDTSTRDHLDIDTRARDWLQTNAPALAGAASGFTMIAAHMSNENIKSMLWGTFIATSLISLILLLVFRSIRIGLICLVPNFIPVLMAFGLWGYFVGNIGLGGSVVTAIAIGIIVDDTIHFLTKYVNSRRKGLSPPDAVRTTFVTVGPALWVTTAILATGFLVLALSGYEPNWALGVLVAITLSFALIADCTLLPALLLAIDRTKSWSQTVKVTQQIGNPADLENTP